MIPLRSLRWAMLVAAAWLLGPVGLSAQVDPLLGDGYTRLVIRGATVIDGTGGPPEGPRDIVVEKGRIVEIVRAGQGRGDRVIEAEGKWVMPGIIDAHTHLGDGDTPPDYVPKLWLAHGITTVRVFSGTEDADAAVSLSRAQRAGSASFDAPHLVVYPFWRGSDPRLWDPAGGLIISWSIEGGCDFARLTSMADALEAGICRTIDR